MRVVVHGTKGRERGGKEGSKEVKRKEGMEGDREERNEVLCLRKWDEIAMKILVQKYA